MAKKVVGEVKLQIPAGQASPSPPVGPALGQRGVNIMEFCKAFNVKTQAQAGLIIPVIVTVYSDRSFTFVTKTPPASVLLKKAAGIEKASKETGRQGAVGGAGRARLLVGRGARRERQRARSGQGDEADGAHGVSRGSRIEDVLRSG